MGDFQTRLRQIMFFKKISQTELVEKTGLQKSNVSRYFTGKTKPNGKALTKIASVLGVDPSWLVGEGPDLTTGELAKMSFEHSISTEPLPFALEKRNRVNVIGDVAAGVPIPAQEDIVGTVLTDKDVFALRIKGDSMSPRIMDGDVVLVDQNISPEDGDVVIALVGDEATCKILKKTHGNVTLVPFNAAYPPFVYTGDEARDLRVLGVVVESRHEWR